MKRLLLAISLLIVAANAAAQFIQGQVLHATELNAALAAPTITGGTINGAAVGLTNAASGRFTTLNVGVGITTAQTAELTGIKILEHTPATAGFAPLQLHNNSYTNTGGGTGTYNHASFLGYNVNRHSSTGTATANKPALIMGMEDNYYDQGGDNQYGMEWYIEYFSPDGTSVQFLRPFYARMLSNNNTQNNALIRFNVGTDGVGQFIAVAGATSLFQITGTAITAFKPFAVTTTGGIQLSVANTANAVNYIAITGGATGAGASLWSTGETNAPLLISSSGSGRVDFLSGTFAQVNFRVAHTASTVNFAQVTGAATTLGPTLSAQGETNVPLNFSSAGTGALNFKTGGGTQVSVANVASAVASVYMSGAATGGGPIVAAQGETNTPLLISSSGSGRIDFLSDFLGAVQFRISRTASSTNFLQVTGSNGGNPVLDASGGAIKLSGGTADIQWGKALVALGGGAAPTVGTIGGSGPATAAQNAWMRVLDSTGAAFWVPVWK